jgi:FMN-dependent NADH-azoreductase
MKLLHIDSSVLGANSASRALSAAITAKQQELHPGLEVTTLDLVAHPLLHLSPAHVGAMFGTAPTDQAVIDDLAYSAPFISQLLETDILVVGVPMYNLTIPTQLKAWIDRVTVAGKTFRYTAEGKPEGLVPATIKVFIASSRGGVYSNGAPAAAYDFQETYLQAAFGFLGLRDITVIRAEGLAVPALKQGALDAAQAQIAALT